MSFREYRRKTTVTRDGVTFPAEWAPYVRTAADLHAIKQGCYLDFAAAEKVRAFFRKLLKHSKGQFAGKPFDLQPWQWEEIILPAYGWKRRDGRRRFRKAYVEVPKKNGKSTLCSGLALWHVIEEPGAEVYLCAADRDQAKIVFNEAVAMVEQSPELASRFTIRKALHEIRFASERSKIEAISSDADSAEGKNASATFVDELHAWRKGREFYESMMYAGRSREQPFIWQITTAGADTSGICWEEHERARRIIDGTDHESIDYLAVIYAAEPDDDWTDVETWKKANPSFGVTMNEASIASDIQEAKGQPTRIAQLKRYGLNLWIGETTAWLDIPTFRAAQAKDRTPTTYDDALERIAACRHRVGGMDLARIGDMAALVWVGEEEDGKAIVAERLFIPGDNVEHRGRDWKVPLASWVAAGWVEATEGDVIDFAEIRRRVVEDAEVVRPAEVGYDAWNAELLCNQLLRIEDGIPTVTVAQQMSGMAQASREFETRLRAGKVEFSASPVLAWQAGNVVTYQDQNDNIRPVKRRSKGKIDGIVATIIAFSRLIDRPPTPGRYYETNPVEFL